MIRLFTEPQDRWEDGAPQCEVSLGNQDAKTVNPFGGIPYGAAGQYQNQFTHPLAWGFGIGTGPQANHFLDNLNSGKFDDSPLGQLIQQGRDVLPQFQQQSNALGQDMATRAPQLFQQYNDAIQQYLGKLPTYQGAGDTALANAGRISEQAFSPIQDQSLYQNALNESLTSAREGAAGRGLLDAGSSQNLEDTTARNLAAQFAQNRQQNQIAATQNQSGLAGNAAQLAGLTPAAQASLQQAYSQMAALQQQGINLPFQALQQYLGFLTSTQNPNLALLQATAPTVASHGKQTGVL